MRRVVRQIAGLSYYDGKRASAEPFYAFSEALPGGECSGELFHPFRDTLFDGVAIASGFLISNWLGYIIFLAVFLHKLPEGFTVASVMLASGQSRKTALNSALMLGVATIAGVFLVNIFPSWVHIGLPISAGVTIYVAATDLVPEVNREPGIRMALVFFAGVAIFFLLRLLAG